MEVIIRYKKEEEWYAEKIAKEIPGCVSLECTTENPALIPVGPNSHCPNTMMILGAALSGGDALQLAKDMSEKRGK